MAGTADAIALNNGVRMPRLGLGVYRSSPADTTAAVGSALAHGYRLIDTAAAYMNERQVGEAIAQSPIPRAELFVETKLWISDYGYDSALRACEISLRKLGLEAVDLYLLHQPMPKEWARTVEAYRAAETLLAEGRVRAIGVSNFSAQHLDRLLARRTVIPAVNQIELHPFFVQRDLREVQTRLGIVTQAWSPLGGVNVYMPRNAGAPKNPLTHPVVVTLAVKYQRTPAQVILRWHLQHGVAVIPKSVKTERIVENAGIFDFELSADDVEAIDALDTGVRGGPDPEAIDTTRYTTRIPN